MHDHPDDPPPPGDVNAKPRKPLAHRLLSGAAWAFAAKIVGLASGVVVNGLLARMLPPEEMGAYFLLISITMFAAVVARFGLKQTVVRLVAESVAKSLPGRAGATLRIVYVIVALGASIVGGGYYFYIGEWLATDVFATPALMTVSGLTALWIAVLAFQTPVAETFRGLHDIRLAVFFDGIIASALLAAMLCVFWQFGIRVTFVDAVLLSVIVAAASLLFGTVLFVRRAMGLRGPGAIDAKEVVVVSAPLFVTNLATQAMTNMSIWVVGAFLVAEDVAIYGAAWRLVNLIALPIMLMNMSVQPIIAELRVTRENDRLQAALRGTATLAGLPALAVLVVFIGFGDSVLGLVFGAHYRQAALVLAILSVGQVINVWTGSCGQVLAFTGHQRQLMTVTLVTGLASAVLAVIGAIYWGVIGVAMATSAGRAIQNIAAWILVHHLTGLWTHASINPSFLRHAAARVMRRRGR